MKDFSSKEICPGSQLNAVDIVELLGFLLKKKLTQQNGIYFSPIMFNEEISFFIKLFSIVFLGLFSGVDAETFSWQKS